HRVELGEVAVRLAAVAGVAQAEAQVVEAGGQPRLVGYVVGRAGAQAVAAWQAALREVVPGYMVPSQVVVLSHWPVTPNGKLDRQALASMVQTPSDTSIVTVPPANDIERTIAATIARVLHLHSVDVTQNFFEMGANSLLLVQAQREMYEALGYEIPILDLFEYSTVRSLAKRVAQQPATDTAAEQGRTRADMRKRAFGGYRRTLTTKNSD
ncbi:MAG: hybrid non-ribosomal peptide synthetase/type I polyketide synthase, partial [Chloroflexi bacterium AL-N10]|nr:hybrid non-ribosomal peptide synthetase/type I polyketide synthase [Chloroflexi bacterium AL-N10]